MRRSRNEPCHSGRAMKVYTPPQHTAKPHGCSHLTTFASVELWVDDLPDAIEIGGELWARRGMIDVGSHDDDWGHVEVT